MGDFRPYALLKAYTPNAEKIAIEAAALCYNSESSEKILKFILASGHESVIEHNAYTFEVCVARVISQMFTRHRIASFSQRSQRYVVEDAFTYYIPPEIAKNEEAIVYYEALQKEIQQLYTGFIELGVPAEKARFMLTNATETTFFMTANARSGGIF